MSADLVLKEACSGCGATADLYGSNCRHMTLCPKCGKTMAETVAPCTDCGVPVTRLIREKYKGKPWVLEDDIGQQPISRAAGRYNFNKVAQYKQLTLEEAEEQMKNRRKTADGYQRWMMKAANTGAAAFSDLDKFPGSGGGGGGGRKRGGDDDDQDAGSDRGEDDMDDEEARRNRLGMNKTRGGDDDGEEPARDEIDIDDEEPEKGDDWEHEETFTDDDEAVGNDPEERDDQVPEGPAPPEIKQEDEEDEEGGQEGQQSEEGAGGLSKSGRELKKLLGKSAGLDESDAEDDEEEDEDVDLDNEEIGFSPVLAPARKDGPKEDTSETTPAKVSGAGGRPTPASATPAKGKRKAGAAGEETKANGSKKAKGDPAQGAKTPPTAATKKDASTGAKASPAATPAKVGSGAAKAAAAGGGVSEEEAKAVLRQTGPIKTQDLVAKFRNRLKTQEDKAAFAQILKKISRIQKTDGVNYIVLRDK